MTLHPCQRQRKCHCQSCPNSSSSSGWWDLKSHCHQPIIQVACVPLLSFTFFTFWYWLQLNPHKIRSLMPAYRIVHKKNWQQLLDSIHFSGNQQDRVAWRSWLRVEFPVWALAIDGGRAIILRTKAETKHRNAAPLTNQMISPRKIIDTPSGAHIDQTSKSMNYRLRRVCQFSDFNRSWGWKDPYSTIRLSALLKMGNMRV